MSSNHSESIFLRKGFTSWKILKMEFSDFHIFKTPVSELINCLILDENLIPKFLFEENLSEEFNLSFWYKF